MTNIVIITNFVWMVTTGTVPVSIQTVNENGQWNEHLYMFISGFSYGLPMAVVLASVWAIVASLRANRFPSL